MTTIIEIANTKPQTHHYTGNQFTLEDLHTLANKAVCTHIYMNFKKDKHVGYVTDVFVVDEKLMAEVQWGLTIKRIYRKYNTNKPLYAMPGILMDEMRLVEVCLTLTPVMEVKPVMTKKEFRHIECRSIN